MNLTQLEDLTLRDLIKDGGRAIDKRAHLSSAKNDRHEWRTCGLKQIDLDTRAVAGLVNKGLVEVLGGSVVVKDAPVAAPILLSQPVTDTGWLGE